MVFLDASALVKAYLDEDGTPTVQALMDRKDGRLVVPSSPRWKCWQSLGSLLSVQR